MILSRSFVVLLALLQLGLIGGSSAFAQRKTPDTPSTGRKIPFNRTVVTSCAEKTLRLNGEFKAQFSVTRDPSGDTFIKADFDAQGITAIGLSSGSKYQAQGTSHFDSRGPSPIEFNYVFNFALNKVKSTDNLMGHVKFRVKVNARGEATTTIVDLNIDCNQ
ncbi:MAG: hypothetical protein ACR2IB_12220 [Pyrinomonadaceae bacterium]